nr:unnamed protein product [Digitaria exilis]
MLAKFPLAPNVLFSRSNSIRLFSIWYAPKMIAGAFAAADCSGDIISKAKHSVAPSTCTSEIPPGSVQFPPPSSIRSMLATPGPTLV